MGMFYSRQNPKIYPQMLDTESSTAKLPLGTKWELADGTVYRYMQAGASGLVSPGQLVRGPAQVSFASQMLGIAASAGSNVLYMYNSGATSMTANQFADGFVGFSDGRTYKIKTHPAVSATSTGLFQLYDNIVSAMASTVSYCLIPHPYAGVLSTVVAAGMSTPVVGVTPMSVTSLYYFWGKVKGTMAVLLDSNAILVSGAVVVLGSEGLGVGDRGSVTGMSAYILGKCVRQGGTAFGMVALGVDISI